MGSDKGKRPKSISKTATKKIRYEYQNTQKVSTLSQNDSGENLNNDSNQARMGQRNKTVVMTSGITQGSGNSKPKGDKQLTSRDIVKLRKQ